MIVLNLSVAKFRALVLQYAQCEPFREAITLASLASFIFRLNFVIPNEIAILSDGLDLSDRAQSKIGNCFLKWVQLTKYPDLEVACDGQEKRIGQYKLDGYSPSENKALEFYGCHWHGCLRSEHGILPSTRHPTFPYYTYEDVNQITLDRERYIKDRGTMALETYWECDVNKMNDFQLWLKETKAIQLISNPITSFREALYGN